MSVAGVGVWISQQQSAPEFPSSAPEIAALAAALALYAAVTAMRGERWLWMLRRGGSRGTRADSYGLTVVGYMGNNVLPLRGGDVLRTYFGADRFAMSYRQVIGTLIAERVLDAILLLGVFFLLAFVIAPELEVPDADGLLLLLAAVAVLALLVAAAVWIGRRGEGVASRVVEFLKPMAEATRELRGRYGASLAAATVGIWATEAATYYAVAASVGFEVTPVESLYILGLIGLLVLIPSGPGYLGTLDAAVLFAADALGASGAEGVSYLLMLRFVIFVPITLAGAVLVLTRYGGLGALRDAFGESGA